MLMHMMQSSGPGNRQVVPIAEDDEMYFDDDIPYEEEESPMKRRYRDQRYFDWRQWYEQCTYENAKAGLKWLMQTASVDFSFTVSPSSCLDFALSFVTFSLLYC